MRCKFRLDSIEKKEDGTAALTMTAVTNGSINDNLYFTMTPYGRLEIGTVNKKVVDKMKIGTEYYIDISEAL